MKILIDNDTAKVLEFDPESPGFKLRYAALCSDFHLESQKLTRRIKTGSRERRSDREKAATKEMCLFMRDKIDLLFGRGTSKMVFGDNYNLNAMSSFFTGLAGVMRNHQANQGGS